MSYNEGIACDNPLRGCGNMRMQREDCVSICFICDDGYVMYTCVAITSIIANKPKESKYDIYIVSAGLSKDSVEAFESLSCEDCSVRVMQVGDPEKYRNLAKEGFPVTPAALFKFDLPSLLGHLNKVLYIDGDVIVQHALDRLFSTDVDQVYAGVVKDYRGLTLKGDFRARLNIAHESYFNSGVMLLNLDLMRRDGISERLLEYRINGVNYYMDQDALNVVFGERVRYLSFNYNFQMTCWRCMDEEQISNYYYLPRVNDKSLLIKNAVIVHYTAEKPWMFFDGKCSEIWMHYFLKSPFAAMNLERKSILSCCRNADDRKRIYQDKLIFPSEQAYALENPPFVTIVMPVYNAERFVNKALGSLKRQTLIDYEVICIDDASSDSTLEILQALARDDERIQVVSLKKNQGAGAARNAGLQRARGEFVTFLDADDLLVPHALERMYQTAKAANADFVFAQTQFDNGRVLSSSYKEEYLASGTVFSSEDAADYLFSVTHGGPSGKMVRRQFIRENALEFLEIARSEDFFFFITVLAQAKVIAGIKEPLYTVVSHANPDSLEHTKDETPLIFWHAVMQVKEWLNQKGLYEKYKRTFINSNITRVCYNLASLNTVHGIMEMKEFFDDVIVKELELREHEPAYFYERKWYDKLIAFSENPIEEAIESMIRRKIAKEAKQKIDVKKPEALPAASAKANSKPAIARDRNYWQGVKDVRASRTYLAGRVITWLPKQLRATTRSLCRNGIQATLKKAAFRIGKLPRELHTFIKVWKKQIGNQPAK